MHSNIKNLLLTDPQTSQWNVEINEHAYDIVNKTRNQQQQKTMSKDSTKDEISGKGTFEEIRLQGVSPLSLYPLNLFYLLLSYF